jgi:photosystem II stability/assembly factor-like uncharacterized protein
MERQASPTGQHTAACVRELPQRLKAGAENEAFIAAVNRCATQKQVFYNSPVRMLILIVFVLAADHAPWWQIQTSGLDSSLRGVSVSSFEPEKNHEYVVWASGSNGVILRSTNEGSTWKQLHVPGGGDLDFRDVKAFDADTAYVISSGDGDRSRIYKTTDGGKSWKLQYSNKRPGFFLDSLACDSRTHCLALSDPVDGKFLVLSTDDGEHWKELPRDQMPAALPTKARSPQAAPRSRSAMGALIFTLVPGAAPPLESFTRLIADAPGPQVRLPWRAAMRRAEFSAWPAASAT